MTAVGPARLFRRAAGLLAMLVIVVLTLVDLKRYPRLWFDEGMNLVAARELALNGRYGLPSSDGFRPLDVSLTTGPTLLLPVAAAFRLFGPSLLVGRLVAAACLLAAFLSLYLLARRLYGPSTGLVAVLLLAASAPISPFSFGRQVLGEATAVGFVCLGAALVVGSDRARAALPAGALFGLAIVTKAQFLLLIPAVLLTWLVARARHPQVGWRWPLLVLLGLAGPVGLWLAYQAAVLGPGELAGHLSSLARVAGASSNVLAPRRSAAALAELAGSWLAIWGVAGLLYCALIEYQAGRSAGRWRPIGLVFAGLWGAWFVGGSVGWPRYALPWLAIGAIFAAKLTVDLLARYVPRAGSPWALVWATRREPLGAALGIVVLTGLLAGLTQNAVAISRGGTDAAQGFAQTLGARVAPGAVVETFEWELVFLADRPFHVPPPEVMNAANAIAFLRLDPDANRAYRVPPEVRYLVDGPYSRLGRVYAHELDTGAFRQIAAHEQYSLYERVP